MISPWNARFFSTEMEISFPADSGKRNIQMSGFLF